MMNKEDPTYEFPELDADERLRELILYVADKCASDEYFGSVKLNKILYFADQVSYAAYGESITGSEYLPLPQGPAPKRLATVKGEMLEAREVIEQTRTVGGGYTQKRIIGLRAPDLTKFSGRDIATIDGTIEFLEKKTASDVSYFSHGRAWRIAYKNQCPMPYEAAFVSSENKATEYETARGLELIEKYHWAV